MHILSSKIAFPDVEEAEPDGLLAIGGDLSVARFLEAYKNGIFPWYTSDQPIMWWSPDPRFVLYPKKLHVSKSMQKIVREKPFSVTYNTNFKEVLLNCAQIPRDGQDGSWITTNMQEAYLQLHQLGYVHSVEVWQNNTLVGGLFGMDVKNGIFSGESMFSKVSNASKYGFITFVRATHYKLIDCQVYTKHLASLGAEEISRKRFKTYLNSNV